MSAAVELEAERRALKDRCTAAIGGKDKAPILCEVLSHFPAKAELFIHTQNHAAQVEGRKAHWYVVVHKTKRRGLSGKHQYEAGQEEHLSTFGFTGELLSKLEFELHKLRGETQAPVYLGIPSYIRRILKAALTIPELRDESAQMTCKLLEIMGVTGDELELLEDYALAAERAQVLRYRAYDLDEQARALYAAADEERDAAAKKIHIRHYYLPSGD